MKRVIILPIVFLLALSAAMGQRDKTEMARATMPKKPNELRAESAPVIVTNVVTIPEIVRTNFYSDFGDVSNLKWYRESNFDVVDFTKTGHKMSAYYDPDGILVGTTEVKTFADLPVKVQERIKDKYKGYSIGPVIFFDDNEMNETDMSLWETQFADEDNYFVELSKGNEKIILRVDTQNEIFYFKKLR
ncbi:MAG: hypothetical protein Q8868_07230 [Bacteroidota bacterium]|nr:hypothetical protein [Bacteroidota bacterium]